MVKARNGLILSLFALVVALVVTTTSTYAWFAMNSTVTAQNMQISVTADNTYLVITNNSSDLTAGKFTGTSVSTTSSASAIERVALLPTKLKAETTPLVWQTAAGTAIDDGTALGYTDIASANEYKYVKKFTFYVGLNPDYSAVDAEDLRVKNITVTGAATDAGSEALRKAVSVCAVSGTTVVDFASANNGTFTGLNDTSKALASDLLADGTAVQVDIYVYINGDNSNVTSENAAVANALGGFDVAVEFAVTPGAA